MADVFISYSRRDTEFTNQLVNALERENRDVWIDWQDIPTGTQFLDEIFEGIASADVFIFIATPNSLVSEFCNYEIQRAIESNKRIVPIIRERIEGNALFDVQLVWEQHEWGEMARSNWSVISHIDWIFADNDVPFDEMYSTLVTTIETDIEHVKSHTRYHVRALDWKSARENPSFLLSGDEITTAEAWLQEAIAEDKKPRPTELQQAFITEARRVEDERNARIADMEARSQRLQQQTRRFQIIAIVAVIIIIFAIGVVLNANQQRDNATNQRDNAIQQEEDAKTQVALAETQVADVEVQIAGAELQLMDAETQVADAKTQVANAETQIALAETQVANAEIQVADAEVQIANAETQVAGAELILTEVSNEVDIQQRNVNALRIASRAEDVFNTNNVLGLSLALEANRLGDNPPTQAQRILSDLAYSPGAVSQLNRHTDRVRDVAFHPTENIFFSSSNDGSILAWDITTSEVIREYRQHTDWVTSVAIHPNGEWMVSGSCSSRILICDVGELIMWDIDTGEVLYQQAAHRASVRDIAFSPSGTQFVTASDDLTLILWDTETGEAVRQFAGHTVGVTSVDFSPSGDTFASGSDDNTVRLWDVATGEEISLISLHQDDVNAVTFNADGTLVASVSDDGIVRVSTALTSKLVWEAQENDREILTVAFDPIGDFVVTGGESQRVIVWDAKTGEHDSQLTGHTDAIMTLTFNDTATYLVSGAQDGNITLWDMDNGDIVQELDAHATIVRGLAISADNTRVLTSSITPSDAPILWDFETGNPIRDYAETIETSVTQILFVPDGEQFITLEDETNIQLRSIETGEIRQTLKQDDTLIISNVVVSPNGQLVAASVDERGIVAWQTATGEEAFVLERQEDMNGATITQLAFSPDSSQLLLATETTGLMLFYDVTTQERVMAIQDDPNFPTAIDFSPDGQFIARSTTRGVNTVWDIATGALVRRLQFSDRRIASIDFSPDSQSLVTNDEDIAIVWDIESGEILRSFHIFERNIAPILYTPDGASVLVADGATVFALRKDSPEQLIDWTLNNRFIRELTCDERFTYNVTPYCNDLAVPPTPTPQATPTLFLEIRGGVMITAAPMATPTPQP